MLRLSFKKLAVMLGSILVLQGCAAALLGGGAIATKVGTDPRTMGTQVDDETLEFKVEDAIYKDAQIKSEGRIEAVSYNGRILLIGQVPNQTVKQTANELARGVDGVKDTYNELVVSPKISPWRITKDAAITTQVKSKMLLDERVKSTDVKVITENGEVFLMGSLTHAQADAAAEIASRISGVARVIKVINYLN